MHHRTASAILVWVAIVLLILNGYFKSFWVFLIGVAMVIMAVVVYFIPRLSK